MGKNKIVIYTYIVYFLFICFIIAIPTSSNCGLGPQIKIKKCDKLVDKLQLIYLICFYSSNT